MLAGWAPRDVPLTPSADEARQWAQSELSKAIYNQQPTLLEQLVNWLRELWERISSLNGTLGPVLAPLLVLAALVLVVGVALLVGGPIRRRRAQQAAGSALVLEDDQRTSSEIRAAAETAATAGEFTRAVLERFRAIVRNLDERVILADRAGRTAHEAAVEAGSGLPNCAEPLLTASHLFDEICYGRRRATREDYQRVCEVDDAVAAAKPVRLATPATDDVAVGG